MIVEYNITPRYIYFCVEGYIITTCKNRSGDKEPYICDLPINRVRRGWTKIDTNAIDNKALMKAWNIAEKELNRIRSVRKKILNHVNPDDNTSIIETLEGIYYILIDRWSEEYTNYSRRSTRAARYIDDAISELNKIN